MTKDTTLSGSKKCSQNSWVSAIELCIKRALKIVPLMLYLGVSIQMVSAVPFPFLLHSGAPRLWKAISQRPCPEIVGTVGVSTNNIISLFSA
jgi:hypothetical protein